MSFAFFAALLPPIAVGVGVGNINLLEMPVVQQIDDLKPCSTAADDARAVVTSIAGAIGPHPLRMKKCSTPRS